MRFIILGGGCYGSFYARQLLRARDADAWPVDEVVVVDHDEAPRARRDLPARPGLLHFETADWGEFLAAYLPQVDEAAGDCIVTPPFTPHLALAWLLGRLRQERPDLDWCLEPFRRLPGTPFERQADGGPLVVSHADWVCPVHCIEPATCPAIRGPRDWDLDRTMRDFTVALEAAGQPVSQVHLFHCHHITHGVGGVPAAEILRARREIRALVDAPGGGAARILVGTISHCHGALHLLVAAHGTKPVVTPSAPPPTSQGPN